MSRRERVGLHRRGRLRDRWRSLRPLGGLSLALLIAAVCLLAFGAGGRAGRGSAQATHSAAQRCRAGAVRTFGVADPGAPAGRRTVWEYVPGTGDGTRMPVLYWLHGFPGQATDIAQAGPAQLLDQAICGGAAPFLLVSPDGNAADGSDTEWSDAADGRFAVERFVTQRLIDVVEGTHVRASQQRAIGGFSMGGFGAMDLALRHRDRYGQVLTVAGYFQVDDPDGTFGSSTDEHDPRLTVAAASGLRTFLGQGASDQEPLVQGEPAAFAAQLRAAGADVTTLSVPGGHDYATVGAVLERALPWLERGFAGDR